MSTLLRDVIDIPERVHRGEFVLKLADGIDHDAVAATIRHYVVTTDLAERFNDALGIVKAAVETGTSRAAYLDGSFGSGKSHFMAILHELLQGNPDVRSKPRLAPVIAKHDDWLRDKRFLLVPFHLTGANTLTEAVLGGYVRHVASHYPDLPPPAVYRDDLLLSNARELRDRFGDEQFLAGLPSHEDDEWGEIGWTSADLDAALDAPRSDPRRRQLVSDLLRSYLSGYRQAVAGQTDAFVPLEEGLSIISRHAREVLGRDALVLLLDELVLWLGSNIADQKFVAEQARLVSKFVETGESERPAPIVSLIPRQRDLRELVGRDVAGAQATTLFDTLKYWDGRFDPIRLSDANLPAIISERLLRPKDDTARTTIDAAFDRITNSREQLWQTLLDAQGGDGSDVEAFRATYPFSPAFVHTMIDISGALQRERTGLRLMLQLLVDFRDVLQLGQLVPIGAIYDVLAAGEDKPFTDKLRQEFEQVRRFYGQRLRPWLLNKHQLTEDKLADQPNPAFRGDDLVVKTLLLKALVPNVTALQSLTASRLAGLNHGWVPSMLGRPAESVAKLLRDLNAEFGEIRVHGDTDPGVDIALIGVDTKAILERVRHVDDDAGRRRLLMGMLWAELGVKDAEQITTRHELVWRGTRRTIELAFVNIRDTNVSADTFEPTESGALKVVLDYPFDEGNFGPTDDVNRVERLREERPHANVLCWIPSFLSRERLADLSDLVMITHVLEGKRLEDVTPHLTDEDRYHARTQLDSRRGALEARIRDACKKAYGVASQDEADLGTRTPKHVVAMSDNVDIRPSAGLSLGMALEHICGKLLEQNYPEHPDFDREQKGRAYTARELQTVLGAVEQAMQNDMRRYELPRAEQPVVRRIADPLGLGTTSEAALVLTDEWLQEIDRMAATAGVSGDYQVKQLRDWISELRRGLPADLIDVVVLAYALRTDRSWLRAGNVVPPPDLGGLKNDHVLRQQELPSPETFQAANTVANGVLGLDLQPVCNARTTRLLADQLRRKAGELLSDAEALVRELENRAELLGLDPTASTGRLATAREAYELLDSIVGVTDDTALLRNFAGADVTKEHEYYATSLRTSRSVVNALNRAEWKLLDQLPGRASGTGAGAKQAQSILDKLRSTARHDEFAEPLPPALEGAKRAAFDLLLPSSDPVPPPDEPGRSAQVGLDDIDTRSVRVTAADAEGLEEIRRLLQEDPTAVYEVSWRRIRP